MRRAGWIFWAASCALSGCVLGDLDLTGKQCPCNGAYVCDETRNVCIKSAIEPRDASEGEEDANDGGQTSGGGGDNIIIDEDGGVEDVGGVPEVCTLDSDCNDAAYICETNRCVLRCDTPSGTMCLAPEVCNPNNGRCVPGYFEIGEDCTINAQCTTGYCLNITTSSAAGNQKFCSIPCSSTTDCPLENSCINLAGISFCLRETAFSPPGNFDTPPGGMCMDGGNDCQSRTCNLDTSQCIQRCTREADCAGWSENCWTWAEGGYPGICYDNSGASAGIGSNCGADSQCRSGVCNRYQGECAGHCCTESDCGPGETCAVYDITATVPIKVCRAKAANAGTLALGVSCASDADCESELCAPESSNGAGPKRCSVPCCEPSDCAVLPNGGLCWPLDGPLPNTSFGTCLPR